MISSIRVNKDASMLRDAVLASTDGIVTTFAVVAGSLGAGLDNKIVVILGLANLVADGLSMASGIFLGTRSESEMESKFEYKQWKQATPLLQAIMTFVSFVTSGFVPLVPFIFNIANPVNTSILFVGFTLILVGLLKAAVVGKSLWKGVLEMLIIGGVAAVAAFFVGDMAERVLRQ